MRLVLYYHNNLRSTNRICQCTQYAVEVNNIFDRLEHEVTEQEYEKDRVDSLWTNIKEGIQKAGSTQYIAKDCEEKQKALDQYCHTRHDGKTQNSEEHPKLRWD